MNEDLFQSSDALTFDDVLIVPGYSEILPSQTDIRARLAGDIYLNVPILSAAMDTVTESRLAIALAREGGIGILHRNMSPEDQAKEIDKVKRSESGMITDPITLMPDATLRDAEALMSHYHISGVPIVEGPSNRLVGILTNRDIRFAEEKDYGRPVSEFMTSRNLVTAAVGTTMEQSKRILQENRIEKLPLVDDQGILRGLITVKDIQKKQLFPNASSDSKGRLLVGAAVGVGNDIEIRIEGMLARGLDVVEIDTAHGHSAGVIRALQRIKTAWPNLPVIAGNVVTAEGTQALIDAGADAVKVGVGAGSICTTRIISGTGMPQMSAIYACARAGWKKDIPVIADGGIKYSGDIVKAIAGGSETVMLGSLMAGLEEAPGEVVLYEGRQFKMYRGMGSQAAMQGYGRDRYGTGQGKPGKLVPEGVEGMVPFKGPLSEFVFQLVGGLRSGMGYAGAARLNDLRKNARFVRITNAGLVESHPHDVTITREAPNYQQRD
ncbi:inosine-5'-monophosphate dehydrogenase [Longilinea arvoryzae]|uniref:Inosine-5'-monophosphate dehydrogenase n=1 Tax=Longilinea arvoryzae TaxID=360412 RepID=A0A0S7BGF4_9CHLR|nr:IMP dehydrogenase [Longilinea arvoryzae]GAP14669.1 inosine-5'-monophosphate dehydrogenase [Longilinea arvoryzae]